MTDGTAAVSPRGTAEVSEDVFYQLGEDSHLQLLGGRLVMEPAASYGHETLFGFLYALLHGYLEESGGGVVLGSRFAMRLDSRWSPEPDLMVVREEHRDRITHRCLEGPADLVVEIASESDPGFEAREKLPRYREAAIPEIWLIDAARQVLRVETFRPEGYESRGLAAGRLASSAVPGFWIEVGWLWQPKLPTVAGCLRQILGTASS